MSTKRHITFKKSVTEANHETLKALLIEKRKGVKDFRFGISGSRIKNVKEARELKREVARILTKMNVTQ